MIPGFSLSVISVLLTIPLNGNPLASPCNTSVGYRAWAFAGGHHTLAIVMISARTPLCSEAKYFPVLPKPV